MGERKYQDQAGKGGPLNCACDARKRDRIEFRSQPFGGGTSDAFVRLHDQRPGDEGQRDPEQEDETKPVRDEKPQRLCRVRPRKLPLFRYRLIRHGQPSVPALCGRPNRP